MEVFTFLKTFLVSTLGDSITLETGGATSKLSESALRNTLGLTELPTSRVCKH